MPFDIRSYRVTPYSLVFYKLPELKKELEKLLMGSVDDSVKYGNPVSDFIPDYYRINLQKQDVVLVNTNQDENINNSVDSEEESGFFDYIFYIQDNSKKMTDEITGMENEMKEMNISVALASKDINRIKEENGNIDANFVRTVCRKLSEPVNLFAKKLNQHISNVCNCWDIIENSYLSLMDNKYIKSTQNLQELKESIISLENMQKSIYSSNSSIEELITALHLSIGIERRLNKACTLLISELQKYLSMTNTIASSIDRIISKGEIVIAEFEKDN